jgi:predicted transcriptional regulator
MTRTCLKFLIVVFFLSGSVIGLQGVSAEDVSVGSPQEVVDDLSNQEPEAPKGGTDGGPDEDLPEMQGQESGGGSNPDDGEGGDGDGEDQGHEGEGTGEQEAETEGARQQEESMGEDAGTAQEEHSEADPQEDGTKDGSEGSGDSEGSQDSAAWPPRGVFGVVVDSVSAVCAWEHVGDSCRKGDGDLSEWLRERLLDDPDAGSNDERAGRSGGSSALEPHAVSRVELPEEGPNLLVWGTGVGLFAAFLGLLARVVGALWFSKTLIPAGWRLDRHRVKEHPVRAQILEHLEVHPGATAQELADVAGVKNNRAVYHLEILKREELVCERLLEGRRHFFPYAAPAVEPERLRKRTLSRSGRPPARVLGFLQAAPGATVSRVADSLGFSLGHAHYHLKRLEGEGLIDRVRRGRRVRHYLSEEGREWVARMQGSLAHEAQVADSGVQGVTA